MEAKFEDGMLVCPGCGEVNLHQFDIDAHFRRDEDSNDGLHVATHVYDVHINRDMSHAYGRRSSLRVFFYCEQCYQECCDSNECKTGKYNLSCSEYSLLIYQHKGSTFMEWEQKGK